MSEKNTKNQIIRSPIVVVMGHVDHGKTTLLDYIRKTTTAAREAGGITQSIGAYEIEHAGRRITFIDTPGHEAFAKMRAAGAEVADLAILVVAADDGVKPQTKEAILTLEAAKTPFVVAINKTDKPGVDLDRVKNELTTAGVLLEGYGGQISYYGISAKTGEGVNDLLDLVLLSADVLGLTYDPTKPASGYILETKMDRQRGFETICIVRNGTLKSGDYIGTPSTKGKIKILENFREERVKELTPSAPALIIGLEKLPKVGEEFTTGPSEEAVTKITKSDISEAEKQIAVPKETPKGSLKLIIKAVDAGSLEALSLIIRNLSIEPKPTVLGESVGDVSDGDVKMAIAMGAVIIGFKIRVSSGAKNLAEGQKVKIITSEIIYDLVKTIEEGLAKPEDLEFLGEVEILAVFNQARVDKQLVGGKVIKGTFRNKNPFEIYRGNDIVGRGRLLNLQQQKKDVGQVGEGNECGIITNAEILIEKGDHLVMKKV
ncbi:MAG: translation initiation factor IF-2 [Patescibacteria group bacterium]